MPSVVCKKRSPGSAASTIEESPSRASTGSNTRGKYVRRKKSRKSCLRTPSERGSSDAFMNWMRKNDYSTQPGNMSDMVWDFSSVLSYFCRIVAMAGVKCDIYVVSQAWEITKRVMSAGIDDASEIIKSNDRTRNRSTTTNHIPPLPDSVKAMIITSISLAVDVCGDFEATFTNSVVAWSHILYLELSGRTDESSMSHLITKSDMAEVDVNCRNFIRMKFMLSAALNWSIRSTTAADYFSYYCTCTCNVCGECFSIQRNILAFNRVAEEVFETAVFRSDPNTAAALVILVCLCQPYSLHTPTPLRTAPSVTKYLEQATLAYASGAGCIKGCLSRIIPQDTLQQAIGLLASPSPLIADTIRIGAASAKSSRVLIDIEDSYFVYEDLN